MLLSTGQMYRNTAAAAKILDGLSPTGAYSM